jgi:peptidoglycan hydrolase CwlO-like protein
MTTTETISGPIVACRNAIKHYTKALEQVTESKRELERKLVKLNDEQSTLGAMREQLRTALRLLTYTAD